MSIKADSETIFPNNRPCWHQIPQIRLISSDPSPGLILEIALPYKSTNPMLLKFFFSRLSLEKQVSYLKTKGIGLGTRLKGGRKIHIYMLNDLFVEVLYKNDNADESPEKLNMLRGLKSLNDYLANEFKTSF